MKKGCGTPETDDTTIDCNGEFIDTKCIIISENIPYLNIEEGDTIKDVIDAIKDKLYFLDLMVTNLTEDNNSLEARITALENSPGGNNFINYNLPTYANSTQAIAGGLQAGDYYVDNNDNIKRV